MSIFLRCYEINDLKTDDEYQPIDPRGYLQRILEGGEWSRNLKNTALKYDKFPYANIVTKKIMTEWELVLDFESVIAIKSSSSKKKVDPKFIGYEITERWKKKYCRKCTTAEMEWKEGHIDVCDK